MSKHTTTLRVMGVPEHFNTPWILAIDDGAFDEIGVNVEFTDAPGGTGEMSQALFHNNTDMALLLTEGALNSVLTGNPCTIHSTYVDSPLLWGVFAGGQSETDVEALRNAPFLVSRFYSGSHLMGFMYADHHNRTVTRDDFTEVGNAEGAVKTLTELPDRLFLWEKYISMPLVKKKKLRLVDTFAATWPAFVAVVRNEYLDENRALVDKVMAIVREYASDLEESGEEGAELVAHLYDLKVKHAEEWMAQVRFSRTGAVDFGHLREAASTLHRLGILKTLPDEAALKTVVAS
jgi:ABC-type nitrate/sulfonate/bicarbonate transport system substrate-binding protein